MPGGQVGSFYFYQFTATGGSGGTGYQWSTLEAPDGLTLDPGGQLSGYPAISTTYVFTVTLQDGASTPVNKIFALTVSPGPQITSPAANIAWTVNRFYSFPTTVSGGMGPYNFSWDDSFSAPPSGYSFTGSTFEGTASTAGTYPFRMTAYSETNSAFKDITFVINPPPLITNNGLPNGQPGVAYNQTLQNTGGTAPFFWTLASGTLPPGLSLSTGGAITGTPNTSGQFSFQVQITDAAGATDTSFFFMQVFSPFVITSNSPLPPATAGGFYSYQFTLAGGIGPYSWFSNNLPSGLSLSNSGLLTGTLNTQTTYNFTVFATDNPREATISKAFALTVNPPITITTPSPLPPTTVGRPTTRTFASTGGTAPITWSLQSLLQLAAGVDGGEGSTPFAAGDLPTGMTLSPSGVLSGTPTVAGVYTFTIRAQDTQFFAATKAFSMTVNATPTFTPSTLPTSLLIGAPFSQTFTGTLGTTPYTWSAIGPLPGGLSLNASTGALTGTTNNSGTFAFQIRLTDAVGATFSRSFTIDVFSTLSVSPSTLPLGVVNTAYNFAFGATGGKPPYTWALKSGSFGAGLALSPSGVLSGNASGPNTYTFTLEVTDAFGSKAQGTFNLTVNALPFFISGPALPAATQGAPYSTQLEVSGGVQPYSFAIIGGTAPAGFAINGQGVLSGTPPDAGQFTFTGQITDAAGGVNTRTFNLTVNGPLVITTATPLPQATVGAAYQQTLQATGGAAPRTWTITGGALPGGLALGPNGTFSGAPNAAGSFSFTARVTDANGATQSKVFTLVTAVGFDVTPKTFTFTGISNGPPTSSQTLSLVSTPPNATVKLTPGAAWLGLSAASVTTPAIVSLTANPQQLAAGTYDTTINVEGPSPYAVNVKFIVTQPAPGQIFSDPSGINISTTKNGPSPTGLITLTALGVNATYSAVAQPDSGSWLSVSPANGSVQTDAPKSVVVTGNPTGLNPGTYKGKILINAPASNQQISVPVNMVISPAEKSLFLSFNGFTLRAVTNGPPPTPREVLVLNAGTGSMDWAAKATLVGDGAKWLSVTPASGKSTPAEPGLFTISIDQKGLTPGEYYGQVDINSPGADGSPQSVTVVLDVRNESPGPEVQPSGVIFTAAPGGPDPASQKVKVVNLTNTALTFVSSSATEIDPNWIDYTPKNGSLPASGSVELTINAKITSLPAGVRRGTITVQFSDGSLRVIDLALVLPSSAAVSTSKNPAAGTCVPTKQVPIFTTLASGFTVSTGWPIPVLLKVVDDCGDPVTEGSVTTSFSTGDPALAMKALKAGEWSTTWTPKKVQADSLTVTGASRNLPGTLQGVVKASGNIKANPNPPVIAASGVLSAASYALDAPIGIGSLVAIFGQRFAEGVLVAPTTPLPTTLGDTQVIIAGQRVPLQFVSGTQINAVVPYDVEFNARQQVIVRRGSAITTPEDVVMSQAQPGVFTTAGNGQGQGVVLDVDNKIVDAANPTSAGKVIIVYATGLGDVSPAVPAGEPAPTNQLSTVVAPVKVTIGGVEAPQVLFAGLAPGFVGLYQLNIVVPQGVAAGDQVPLVITVAGQIGSTVTLAVR